jgi:CubicO group peptidase (beta-lactamase class C family)
MRRSWLTAVAPSILCCLLACARSTSDDAIAVSIDGWLTGLHEQEDFSGAVVVGRDGVVLYERGFGFANVDAGVLFTPDTPTNIASVAKTLTAAAIMMLVADRRVELVAPVTTYLAEFPYPRRYFTGVEDGFRAFA